ncbi:polysaccharide biosynthesis protein [Polynucleobacter sp. MWH-HuK1]|uniref:polysaccharide biosynthesis protein n=1 Tax=Polynucleobacter sp. MWH-HuK1 TaxID=1743158 RepID=UPI001C0E3778|nr:polysaccharide biosynthesis protein [Polynucleobacter sp. MWH-HuK1]
MTVLGLVLDANKLGRICRRFGVQAVFHEAIYRHVSTIDMNPAAGVWNNVFGTLRAIGTAFKYGLEAFVLTSADKAVRPTNVMSCYKRLVKLVLQAKSMQEIPLGLYAI